MIKIPCRDHYYWMDGILHKNLLSAKTLIKEDWDFLYVIDGKVGTGKSVLAQQIAYFVSEGKLKLEQICFTATQFKDAILAADKYEAIVFDEAFRGLSGKSALSSVNKQIVELLNEIRQKNLFIFIVLPSMWDLDRYITQHRCGGVFHVYYLPFQKKDGSYGRERGHVRFYREEAISYIIGNSKIRYVYPKTSSFKITFKEYYPLSEHAYKSKKGKALQSVDKVKVEPFKERFAKLYQVIMGQKLMTQRKLADLTGYDRNSLRVWGKPAADNNLLTPDKGLIDDQFLDIRRKDEQTIQIPTKMPEV